MNTIETLLHALEERVIAQNVGIVHDEARVRYTLHANTVNSFEEFSSVISEYYNYHFAACFSGSRLPDLEAASRAKEIVSQHYARRRGDISTASNDAMDGTNGGLRAILDLIAEGLKAEAIEHYIRDVFDRYVAPNDWDQKVRIIQEFITQHGTLLGNSIQTNQPERYAHDYENLIRSYVTGLQQASSLFRRH